MTNKWKIIESYSTFQTLENAWDKSTLNNNLFEKTVNKLSVHTYKEKTNTTYIFEDGSSLDTDNLNPFECTYATFVSEDLSFVYEFK